ncbi:MAG TPA: hypothetical protein VFA20_22805 [Myxococcaceae bacterium]|nr:hypothetical protein [Myxococcaceae bacterium]
MSSCMYGRCACRRDWDGQSGRIQEPDIDWEILPHKVIGPCTYQYEPQKKSWDGSVTVQINETAYPGDYEVDREDRILQILKCPGGQPQGHPDGGLIDIVFEYDIPGSAQPEYYEPTSDEGDRKLFPREPPSRR